MKNIITDPQESAEEMGLRYVSDEAPGITRVKHGKSFEYKDTHGKVIKDKKVIERINALAIPPAYKDVWICPSANGHLQATGRDARNRKQYRYHAKWREVRDLTKYDRMQSFGKALPKIRSHVKRDLKLPGLPRPKVLATVIALIEKTFIRVGNDEYAKNNHSYGLTTMQDKHVKISAGEIKFQFKGKSGVNHSLTIEDPRLAKIVKKCQDLPGQELLQYLDEEGNVRDVTSADVNEYLKQITGEDFTAKDFRTWHGTVMAVTELKGYPVSDKERITKKNLLEAIDCVARYLGNTQAICRKCYIHPEVISSFLDGSFEKRMHSKKGNDEAIVLDFLQKVRVK